jgi:hypothetical protein
MDLTELIYHHRRVKLTQPLPNHIAAKVMIPENIIKTNEKVGVLDKIRHFYLSNIH